MSSANESQVETYSRQTIPIVLYALSLLNIGFLGYVLSTHSRCYSTLLLFLLFSVSALIHLLYTLTYLLAPRFTFKGPVFVKTAPWIVSGWSMFLGFLIFDRFSTLFCSIYCIAGMAFQTLHYVVSSLPEDGRLSPYFKPYKMVLMPNIMSKISLTNGVSIPADAFGPPIQVVSQTPGQYPTIVRYGSQAPRTNANLAACAVPSSALNTNAPSSCESLPQSDSKQSNVDLNELPPSYEHFSEAPPAVFPEKEI